jgi:hypothetical protein
MKASTNLHVLRSKKANAVMGTGSVAFGFKRVEDARIIAQKVKDIGQNVKVWYTAIKPDKFVLTTAPKTTLTSPILSDNAPTNKYDTYNSFDLVSIDSNTFLNEMLTYNLSVRVIERIKVENNFYTLYSDFGYEPYYTNDELVIMFERQMML